MARGHCNCTHLELPLTNAVGQKHLMSFFKHFWPGLLQHSQKGKWPETKSFGGKTTIQNHMKASWLARLLADGLFSLLFGALVGDLEYMNSCAENFLIMRYKTKPPCAIMQMFWWVQMANSWKDCRLSANWLSMQWKPAESLVLWNLQQL